MNHPDAAELLAVARETLMKEVFPRVPESLHYEMRMIASAMGMAAREAEHGAQAREAEIALCATLLPETVHPGTTSQEASRQALADAIRAGRFDDEAQQQSLHQALCQTVQSALGISNPRALRTSRELV